MVMVGALLACEACSPEPPTPVPAARVPMGRAPDLSAALARARSSGSPLLVVSVLGNLDGRC